jgi:hypothetical protein
LARNFGAAVASHELRIFRLLCSSGLFLLLDNLVLLLLFYVAAA